MVGQRCGSGGCSWWWQEERCQTAGVPGSGMAVPVSKLPSMCPAPRSEQAEGWRMLEGVSAA